MRATAIPLAMVLRWFRLAGVVTWRMVCGSSPAFRAAPLDLIIGEAQPAVRMSSAQELELMWQEVYDQKPPSWRQQTRGGCDGRVGTIEIVQNLVEDDHIRFGRIRSTGSSDSRLPCRTWAWRMCAAVQIDPRGAEHRVVRIETNRPGVQRAQDFEDAARPGAQIDEKIDRVGSQEFQHGRFDFGHRLIEGTNSHPLGRIGLEIGVHLCSPSFLDGSETCCGRRQAGDRCCPDCR